MMERDLDLSNLLETGDPPTASPEGLEQVVRRHRRYRGQRHRAIASLGAVVALAVAGVGVGLGVSTSAKGPTQAASRAPAGLKWDGATAPVKQQTAAPGAENPHGTSAPVETTSAAPGEFGFVISGTTHGDSTHGSGAAVSFLPTAVYTNAGGGYGAQTNRFCGAPCAPVFSPGLEHVLFVRRVDGVTITATQVSFTFPLNFRSEPVGSVGGTVVSEPPTPSASSGAGSSGSGSSSGSGTASPPPSVITPVKPISGTCPSSTELEVTISGRGGLETLLVPAGGAGTRPFSVLASADADLPGGGVVVLAVARTSPAVASVRATFASGRIDAMAPKDSWSVLAEVVPTTPDLATAGAARVVAESSSGSTLETATLPAAGSLATAPSLVCHYLVEPLNSVGVVSPPHGVTTPTTGSSTTPPVVSVAPSSDPSGASTTTSAAG